MRWSIFLFVFSTCSRSMAGGEQMPPWEQPISASHPRGSLTLFLPGLASPREAMGLLPFGGRVQGASPWPVVQFTNFLTGTVHHRVHGERFFVAGHLKWGSEVGPGRPPLWGRHFTPRERLLWLPGEGYARGLENEGVLRFHRYRSTLNREEKIQSGGLWELVVPRTRRRPGERWRARVEVSKGAVTLTFHREVAVLTSGGNAVITGTLRLLPGQSRALHLFGRAERWYLYVHLVALDSDGPVLYRMGPSRGAGAPWPDFSALRRRHLEPETFARQVMARFLTQTPDLAPGPHRAVVAYVDYFDLLARGLSEGPLLRKWRAAGLVHLVSLVRQWTSRGEEVLLVGSAGQRRPLRRVDLSAAAAPESVLGVPVMATLRLFGPASARAELPRRLGSTLEALGAGTYGVAWRHRGSVDVLSLPPGIEAGRCPRRRLACEPGDGAVWGHSGRMAGWFLSTVRRSGRHRTFADLSREIEGQRRNRGRPAEKMLESTMTTGTFSWYER